MPELDTKTAGSPGWWLVRLEGKLNERCSKLDILHDYYRGEHPLPEGDDRMRDFFRKFQRKARTNYMALISDSVAERLEITGFRAGGGSAGQDHDVWRLWQANHLDADSSMAHFTASELGVVYVIIGPGDPPVDEDSPPGDPLITIEDPRQVIAETDPVNRRRVRAAVKIWCDDLDGKKHAVLYLTDAIYFFECDAPKGEKSKSPGAQPEPSKWTAEIIDPDGELAGEDIASDVRDDYLQSRIENQIAPIVPVVPFMARPQLDGTSLSEFEKSIDVQDRINDTLLNRLVVGKMQAYRQRWVTGISAEDEDGKEVPLPFVPGVDMLWAVEDPNAKFGDFAQSDLKPFLDAVKDDVEAIVALEGLPPHYVAGNLVNASADAIAAAESRWVARCKARMRTYGEAWELVLRIAFAYLGQPERIGVDAEVRWASPERQSIAQIADAAVKKKALDVPWEQLMLDVGYTPTQIDTMRSLRVSDAALLAAFGAPPVPVPG